MLGWLKWTHLWPFIPMCVLGDFRQFGHWVLASISCCMRDIISFSFSFRVLTSLSLLRILCRSDRSVYLCSWKNRNCYMTDILSSRYWTTDNQNDLLGIVLSLPQEWKCLFFCEICSVQMNISMTITLTGSCAPCMKTCRCVDFHTTQ